MSGLIKELLLDFAMGKLSIDLRSDIVSTIAGLQKQHILRDYDLSILDAYLSGYNAVEIAISQQCTTQEIETTLERVFSAIEHASGYTDHDFVNTTRLLKKYPAYRLPKMLEFLKRHGQQFITHDIVKVQTHVG